MEPRRVGVNHIAIAYPDREAFLTQLRHLKANGVEFIVRGNHGMTHSAYIADPDGYGLEVLYNVPEEVWSGDVDAALNYFEYLPAEQELEDTTDYQRFAGRPSARRSSSSEHRAMGARTGEAFLKGLRARKRELWLGDERVDDVTEHPALAGAAAALAAVFDLPARVPRRLPDARPGDGRADQRQPHDPALEGRPAAAPPRAGAHRRGDGRADGPHARLHERDLRRFRRRAQGVARARRAATRRAWPTSRAFQQQLAREDICLTHTIVHPTVDRVEGPVVRRQPGAAAQGGRHRARHRRARAPASWPRWRRSPTRSPSTRATRWRPTPPPPYALSFSIPMDTPGLIFLCRDSASTPGGRPVRPPAVDALRRAGRVRHLRRRRGARATGSSSTATSTSTTR